jgi:hypothetical protein
MSARRTRKPVLCECAHASRCEESQLFASGIGRDTTPQQDSLSGVIICPAYWIGQRLRANSFATTNTSIKNDEASIVKDYATSSSLKDSFNAALSAIC